MTKPAIDYTECFALNGSSFLTHTGNLASALCLHSDLIAQDLHLLPRVYMRIVFKSVKSASL